MTLCRPCCYFHCAERTHTPFSRFASTSSAHSPAPAAPRARAHPSKRACACMCASACACLWEQLKCFALYTSNTCFQNIKLHEPRVGCSNNYAMLIHRATAIHLKRTKCATVKHSRPIGDRCTATRCTRRTCLRNKQGSSRVRRPNLRSLSNPDR